MADACYEIYKTCQGSCVVSGSSDADKFFFKCGGKDGCANNAIVRVNPDIQFMYYHCNGTKWTKITENDLDKYAQNVRDCGIQDTDKNSLAGVYNGTEYDFFTEPHEGWLVGRSDICKKPKTNKVEKTKDTTKPAEIPVVKDTPAPVSASKKNNITISGTVVDENGEPLPFVNIAEVESISLPQQNGTITNIDGKFELSNLNPDDQVQFSYVGYETQKLSVSSLQSGVNVVMKSGAVNLNEVNISPCDTEKGETFDPETKKCIEPKSDIVEEIKPDDEEEKPNESPKPETPVTPSPDPKELAEKLKTAQNELAAAKEKENSWANRGLSAASTAMTGLGGMQLAQGIAEKKADADAEKEMRAYIETMKCDYGGGKNITMGNEEITLPGGNELLEYYTEYKTLADNLKTTKAALGLRSGIESEVLYDRAQTGLYQYATAERKSGAEISLSRALSDSESEDAAAWAEQKENASKKLKAGGGVATGGAATGVVGNAAINTDMIQNIKDAFKK